MVKAKIKQTKYIILLAVTIIFSYCSPKTNHKVLSFFFDGVPYNSTSDSVMHLNKVNSSDSSTNKVVASQTVDSKYTYHPPYKEGNCEACHDKNVNSLFNAAQPELCYTCHEDFSKKFAFVHGPVSAGYCTECHQAHISELPKLLLRKSQNLCLHCHDASLVLKNEVHAEIGETNCIDCHNPHGGSDRYYF